jgi:hypothetical protein
MIRAVVALHSNKDRLIDAYGIAFRDEANEPYAIASVYLDEPLTVNNGLRAAIAKVAEMLQDTHREAIVLSRERVALYPNRREAFTRPITSMKLTLKFANTRQAYKEALMLAEDAASRQTTITEVF